MVVRAQEIAPSDAPPAALAALTDRFDPEVMDVPSGAARVRLEVRGERAWDAVISSHGIDLIPATGSHHDAELSADAATWEGIADDLRGGMSAFRGAPCGSGATCTSGSDSSLPPAGWWTRPAFSSPRWRPGWASSRRCRRAGKPHRLHPRAGGHQGLLSSHRRRPRRRWRVIAVDLPGFGESDKPLGAAYDAPYFAGAVKALLDELGIERAHLVGNSMGGRVAIEVGLLYPERVGRIALLSPALAWLRDRRWRWLLRAPLPMLGLIQPAPRVITEPIVRSLVPGGRDGWSAAGVDEFLRSYLTPRGRVAFYEAARNIYLDEPHGAEGLWTRLARSRRRRCSFGAATTSSCRSASASTWSGFFPPPVTSSSTAPTCLSSSDPRRRTGRSASSSERAGSTDSAGVGALAHPERGRGAFERSRAIAEVIVRDEVSLAAPPTSLNEPIGAHRRLGARRAPLQDLKQIKNALGGTVNDVVLAVAAGGFRDLLQGRGEPLPHQGLRAMVPMNIRAAGEHLELGNQVSSLFVHLPVAEPDPLMRYQRQVKEAEGLKAGRQALGSKTLIDITALAPPAIHSFLARSLFATRLFNVTITNVPGPPAPLYAFGARLREVWPLVPIAASRAVGIAVVSYDGDLFFCINADRDSVHRPIDPARRDAALPEVNCASAPPTEPVSGESRSKPCGGDDDVSRLTMVGLSWISSSAPDLCPTESRSTPVPYEHSDADPAAHKSALMIS